MTNTRLLLGGLAIALLASACGPKADEGKAEEAPVSEHSSAGLPAGDVAAGEKFANTKQAGTGQACIECHGKEGAAPIDPSYPVLAGQYADYIASALEMYRDGRRQNPLMAAQAKNLKDQDIANLAAYMASRPQKVYDLSEHDGSK
ncbi:c-type cytochrome [Cognatilysobacter lacus]|uniref:C-type cytochrome n=1 Tax=Cognatilysobacter lacus TaxID=1643323 RepID=A0A5D8Z8X2_9GAMM|nr:c-type cytochrome [Lysobacter lacus]TZF91375.1 c-type cytochrome [Lysobacter lacus]